MAKRPIYIADNIKRLRQIRGLNRSELAELLDVSGTMVSNYEKGVSVPPLKMIDHLCHVLDVGIEDLVYGKIYAQTSFGKRQLTDADSTYAQRLQALEKRLMDVEADIAALKRKS